MEDMFRGVVLYRKLLGLLYQFLLCMLDMDLVNAIRSLRAPVASLVGLVTITLVRS